MVVNTQVAIAFSILLYVSRAQSTPCPPSGCPASKSKSMMQIHKRIEVDDADPQSMMQIHLHQESRETSTATKAQRRAQLFADRSYYSSLGGGTSPTFCEDIVVNGVKWHDSYGSKFTCEWYKLINLYYENKYCRNYGSKGRNTGYVANEACCVCGGGLKTPASTVAPPTTTAAPTPAPTPAPTLAPTPAVSGGGSKKECEKCLKGFTAFWKKQKGDVVKKCNVKLRKACIKKARKALKKEFETEECSTECNYFSIEESAEEQGGTTFNAMDEEEGEDQEGKTTFNAMDEEEGEDEDDEDDEADLEENKVVDDDKDDEADFEEDTDVDADAAGAEHH